MRLVLTLALVSLAACTASHGLVITRDATSVTVSVDADQLPADDAARTLHLVALAAKACRDSNDDIMVLSQRLVTREDVQLDVDRVWASLQKSGAPTAWATSGTSEPVITPVRSADARSVRVQIPVWELSIECGG
ncbi:MAG: hypothetical protein Q8L14_16035 [Myxococcales bacterium]|nr:hypothetical protein [Myxococcales bacterium]